MKKLCYLVLVLLLFTAACDNDPPKVCQPKEIDPQQVVFIDPAAKQITAVVYWDPVNPGNQISHPGEDVNFAVLKGLFRDLDLTVLTKEQQDALPHVTNKAKAALELNFDAGDALFIYSDGYITIYPTNGCEKVPLTYVLSPETVKLIQLLFILE